MKLIKLSKVIFLLVVSFYTTQFSQPSPGNEDAITGKWLMPDQMGTLEIFKCNDLYCGKIIEITEKSEDGGPLLDIENPDENLQNRTVLGLQVMSEFKYAGENLWNDGNFYIPRKGKETSPDFILIDDNHLNIEIAFFIFSKTVELTRVRDLQTN